jgi:hypothetical protein
VSERVLYGLIKSVGLRNAPHVGHSSPLAFGSPQFGHIPLTYLSGRNFSTFSSKNCFDFLG